MESGGLIELSLHGLVNLYRCMYVCMYVRTYTMTAALVTTYVCIATDDGVVITKLTVCN